MTASPVVFVIERHVTMIDKFLSKNGENIENNHENTMDTFLRSLISLI